VLDEEKTRNGILSTLRTAAKLAPIGYPDRYSIEQTPSDRITFCSKTGFQFLTGDYYWETSPALGPDQFRPLWTCAHDLAATA
jgi:hypothetical protein